MAICDDYNLTLNPNFDGQNYLNFNRPRGRLTVLDIITEYGLIDLYRYFYPNKRRYTCCQRIPLKEARLDYILTSDTLVDLVDATDIKPSYIIPFFICGLPRHNSKQKKETGNSVQDTYVIQNMPEQ